jgi:hypothetical protein
MILNMSLPDEVEDTMAVDVTAIQESDAGSHHDMTEKEISKEEITESKAV